MQTHKIKEPPKSVLVVEDDPFLLQLLEELIADTGRQVYTAANGDQAVELIKDRADIEAVITDLAMPEMDGVRLIQWLNEEFPQIPVLVVTATNTAEIDTLLAQRRVHAAFQKPLTSERIGQLLKALNSLHA